MAREKTSVALEPTVVRAVKKACIDLDLTLSSALEVSLQMWLLQPTSAVLPTGASADKIEAALQSAGFPRAAAEAGADLVSWFFTVSPSPIDQQVKLSLAGLIREGHLRAFVEAQQGGVLDPTDPATEG